jgi:hypothetical protein
MITHIPYSQVLDRLERFIRQNNPLFFEWYIGLSDQPAKTLFEVHMVDKSNDIWFYEDVPSASEAGKLQNYFLTMGCMGKKENNLNRKVYIYAFHRSVRKET